jgi:hypothetical protein
VGSAAAFGLAQLAKQEAPPASHESAGRAGPGTGGVNPAEVTVSVLNGTTVRGLAARVADKVEAAGFQLGNVTNDANQQRQESVVLYRIGHEREARLVGRRLGIPQRERIDPSTQALAGDATVVVVSGGDQSR